MSKIATGLVLFSLLMALSLGVAFAEKTVEGNASENVSLNNTTSTENVSINNTAPGETVPLNNTTSTEKPA